MPSTRSSLTAISTSPVGMSGFFAVRMRTTPLAASTYSLRAAKAFVKRLPGGALVKGQLDDAGAIPQIDEYQLSQIPLPLYPAEHRDLLALVFRPEVPAVRGAFESLDAFCHG